MMHRRRLLFIAAASAAAPGVALADVTRTPLNKAFPLLDVYLGLPAPERSRFYLAYRAVKGRRPVAGGQATIVAPNGARFPVGFDRGGLVLALPTLALIRSGAVMETVDPDLKLGPELRATIPASTHIDVGQLGLALAQVNAAVAKIAGPMSLVAPKFDCAFFPDSGGGQAVTADGHAAPLQIYASPFNGPTPYFMPERLAAARTVVLTRAPSRIVLDPHPHGV